MTTANRTWGEERIAAELLVKLGIHVSPRNGSTLHAAAYDTAFENRVAGVEHVRAESRTGRAGL
jgi:hypothetical protein